MVVRESIYLNPNLDKSGINGKLDLRGIVIITVSGTVHRSSHYVGLFEQVGFGDNCSLIFSLDTIFFCVLRDAQDMFL